MKLVRRSANVYDFGRKKEYLPLRYSSTAYESSAAIGVETRKPRRAKGFASYRSSKLIDSGDLNRRQSRGQKHSSDTSTTLSLAPLATIGRAATAKVAKPSSKVVQYLHQA